jgi:hypothetical protein
MACFADHDSHLRYRETMHDVTVAHVPYDRHGAIVEREKEAGQRPYLTQTAAREMETAKRILPANAPLPSRSD